MEFVTNNLVVMVCRMPELSIMYVLNLNENNSDSFSLTDKLMMIIMLMLLI